MMSRVPFISFLFSTIFFIVFTLGSHTTHADEFDQKISQLKQSALSDDYAYHLIESLTTEVGARLVGTDRALNGIDWAENQLQQIGITNITRQPVKVRNWQRISAAAKVTSPYSHNLVVTALGGSISTPKAGIEADIIRFSSIEHLQSAKAEDVAGKIVYIAKKLIADKTGDDYIKTVLGRQKGAIVAAQLGAKAIIIRSITTDNSRIAHTGGLKYLADVNPIPAAAISPADADLLDRLFSRNLIPSLHLTLVNTENSWVTSYNLIAELAASDPSAKTILLAAHLDSWDLGTGALDNAAGVGVIIGALKQLIDLNMPLKRNIKVVFFTDSQLKQSGVQAYIKQYEASLKDLIVATEMDFGAGLIWRLDTNIAQSQLKQADKVHDYIADLGIIRGHNQSLGSTNTAHLKPLNIPLFQWVQDPTQYFKYLHSANDTFDKIELNAIQQNVATLSVFSFIVANSEMQFKIKAESE